MAHGILIPYPRIEPVYPAVETQSLHHWTAKGVTILVFLQTFIPTDFEESRALEMLHFHAYFF